MFQVSFDEKTLGEHPKALYVDGTRISDTSPESRDKEKQKRLWEGSLQIAGVRDGDTVLRTGSKDAPTNYMIKVGVTGTQQRTSEGVQSLWGNVEL
jgi:hypothetical protein